MRLLFQILLALFIFALTAGPIGHFLALSGHSPDLAVLACWAYVWFFGREEGLRFALLIGLLLDVSFFLPVGVWTLSLVFIVSVIDYIKNRFLNVSSSLQALMSLAVVTLLVSLFFSLVNQSLDLLVITYTLIINLLLGSILFFILSLRLRLNQRWSGRRI